VYVLGANLLAVIHDDGPGALSLLLKGEDFRLNHLRDYPKSFRETYWGYEYQIPLLLAYTYLFEMDNLPKAAEAYEEAAAFPQAPDYIRDLVHEFHSKDGQYIVASRLLKFMIAEQKDVEGKQKLEKKRAAIDVHRYLFDVNHRFRTFLSQKKFSGKNGDPGGKRSGLWRDFLIDERVSEVDPWGGTLSLDSSGNVVTTTEHEKVFGLE
jgi:hypothetical protein